MTEPVPLKEHLEGKIADLKELLQSDAKAMRDAVQTAMAAADKATDRSDAAMQGRLDVLNEFRGAVDVLIANCPTRSELDVRFKPLEEFVTSQRAQTAGQTRVIALISGAAFLLVALISIFSYFQPDPITGARSAGTVNIEQP